MNKDNMNKDNMKKPIKEAISIMNKGELTKSKLNHANNPMTTKTPTINVSPRFSLRLAPAVVVLVALAISIQLAAHARMAPNPTIITFDAPAAAQGPVRALRP